jgi:hypothetical protein
MCSHRDRAGTSSDKLSGDKTSSDYEETLENELKALKLIDTDLIMKNALLTRVRKDGILGKDERIKTVVHNIVSNSSTQSTRAFSQASTGKIEARIRSSKKVAEVMRICVESLRQLVLSEDKPEKSAESSDEKEHDAKVEAEDTEANVTGEAGTGAGTDDERSPYDGFSDAGWESGSIDDTDLRNVDEDEGGVDSDWESGSVLSKSESHPSKKKIKLKTSKDLPQKAPVQSALAPTKTQSLAQSTFLPSLATGYIGADSSADDHWSDAEGPFLGERKNRRGQRARRA